METATQRSNRRLALIVSGFAGIVMGLYLQFLAGLAFAALWLGILLWLVANVNAGTGVAWRPRVYYCAEVLVVFGALAMIGFAMSVLLTL